MFDVNIMLGHAVGAMYVRKYLETLEEKKKVEEMQNNIRKQFVKMLNEYEWLDEQTRNRAKR